MSYAEFVEWTLRNHPERRTITHAALGIAGEAGEVVEQLKRQIAYRRPLDREKLVEELGDLTWYLRLLCNLTDITPEEIEGYNRSKLTERFGGKQPCPSTK